MLWVLLDTFALIGALTISIILASFVIVVIAMSMPFQRWYKNRLLKVINVLMEEMIEEDKEEA